MHNGWNSSFDDEQDMPEGLEEDLRLLNQVKMMELTARYGGCFVRSEEGFPAEMEMAWLESVERFEEAWQSAKRTTVRSFLGDPDFPSLAHIAPENLEEQIDRVLDRYHANNVEVDFLSDVPVEEVYRFLTEELLDHEMDDIRLEGYTYHFIYEESHPNDEHDVKECAESFLTGLFYLEADLIGHLVADEGVVDACGHPLSQERFRQQITEFRESFLSFDSPEIDLESWNIDGDTASVMGRITWKGTVEQEGAPVVHTGIFSMKLVRSPWGGWEILQVIVPGWNGHAEHGRHADE